MLKKTRGRLNWALFYVSRYLRLTPIYMFILFFYITISLHFISGPYEVGLQQQQSPQQQVYLATIYHILYLTPGLLVKDYERSAVTARKHSSLYRERNQGSAQGGELFCFLTEYSHRNRGGASFLVDPFPVHHGIGTPTLPFLFLRS